MGAVMRRAAMLAVLPGLLCLAACRDEQDESPAPTVASTPSELGGELIEIRTKMQIAAEERTEPIATGEVVEGPTVGDSTFCVGGTIRDSHGSDDPSVSLIARRIICPDGTLNMNYTEGDDELARIRETMCDVEVVPDSAPAEIGPVSHVAA